MSESFAELLEESLRGSEMKPGAVIEAEVVDINGDYVIVNAGLKSESEIPASQFRDSEGAVQVNIGDRVEVAIETVEDGYGNTRLSRERARRAKNAPTRRPASPASATRTCAASFTRQGVACRVARFLIAEIPSTKKTSFSDLTPTVTRESCQSLRSSAAEFPLPMRCVRRRR